MAQLEVVESIRLAKDGDGNVIMAPEMPPVAEQQVDFSGGETKSAVFNERTRFLYMISDVDVRLKFGADPTASSTSAFLLKADVPVFVGIQVPANALKLSAISA